ncbi:MAG: hypothetical protein PVI48_11710 [Gammaproteobacteria bacterium]
MSDVRHKQECRRGLAHVLGNPRRTGSNNERRNCAAAFGEEIESS